MTTKRRSAGNGASEPISSLVTALQAPAATSFRASQQFALEATRFWVRRMRSYADQMETLANCSDVNDVVRVQSQFLERMRQDYAEESEAVGRLWQNAQEQVSESVERIERES